MRVKVYRWLKCVGYATDEMGPVENPEVYPDLHG